MNRLHYRKISNSIVHLSKQIFIDELKKSNWIINPSFIHKNNSKYNKEIDKLNVINIRYLNGDNGVNINKNMNYYFEKYEPIIYNKVYLDMSTVKNLNMLWYSYVGVLIQKSKFKTLDYSLTNNFIEIYIDDKFINIYRDIDILILNDNYLKTEIKF